MDFMDFKSHIIVIIINIAYFYEGEKGGGGLNPKIPTLKCQNPKLRLIICDLTVHRKSKIPTF